MALFDNPFVRQTLFEFYSLLGAPIEVPQMWWIITPLIAVILLTTFYFGKYVNEKAGYDTALSSSIVLFFVCIDLLRNIYNYTFPASFENYAWNPFTTALILIIILESVLLLSAAFRHSLPEKVMFFVASPVAVNVQAYVMAAVVYTKTEPTLYTLFAGVFLFLILMIVLRIIKEIEHFAFGYHTAIGIKESIKNKFKPRQKV
jgi:hypothetical protein